MKNEINCEIIKDLLPLYVDKLVSEETKNIVEEHIEECYNCKSTLEDMNPVEKINPEDNIKQVDCFKKIKKKSRKKIVISILLGMIVTLVGVFAIWMHGFPVPSNDLEYSTTVRGKDVIVEVNHVSDTQIITSLKLSEHNGIVDVHVRAHSVPDIFRANRTYEYIYTSETEVSLVRMGGNILWENGTEIRKETAKIYNIRHSLDKDILLSLGTDASVGVRGWDSESSESFDISKFEKCVSKSFDKCVLVRLNKEISASDEEIYLENMRRDSCVLLALKGYMGTKENIVWKYNVDGNSKIMTFSKEEASDRCGKDIIKFGDSISNFQELMDILELTPKIKFHYRSYHLEK